MTLNVDDLTIVDDPMENRADGPRTAAASDPFDGLKTTQMPRPDALASTVVWNEPSTVSAPSPMPSLSVASFGVQTQPPPGVNPGEFSSTMTLSKADLVDAGGKPALPFARSTPIEAPPVERNLPTTLDAIRTQLAMGAPLPQPIAPIHAPLPVSPVSPEMPAAKTIGQTFVTDGYARTSAVAVEAPTAHAAAIAATTAPEAPREAIVLLYLHRPSMPRIVRKPAWQPILDARDDEPVDPESDDPALSPDPAEIQEQSEAYAILKKGRCIDRDDALAALDVAANKAGRFAPPMELFQGEIEPALDEIEVLRGLLAIIPEYVPERDARLEKVLGAATTFMNGAGATYARPLVKKHIAEVRQAYGTSKPTAPIDELDALVVQTLVEQRQYQKQRVLGGEHIRTSLHQFGQSQPLIVYIPADAAMFLPLAARFSARILAEIHFAQDHQNPNAMALRCLALANVIRRNAR